MRAWANSPTTCGPACPFVEDGREAAASTDAASRWPAFMAHLRSRIEAHVEQATYDEGWRRYVTAYLENKTFELAVDPSSPHLSSHYFGRAFFILFRFRRHGVVERVCYSHLDLRTHERSYRPVTYRHTGTYSVALRSVDGAEVAETEEAGAEEGEEEGADTTLSPPPPHCPRTPQCRIAVVLQLPNLTGTTLTKEYHLVDNGKRLDVGNQTISYVLKKRVNKLKHRARLFVFNVNEKRKLNKMLRQQRRGQAVFFDRDDTAPAQGSASQTDDYDDDNSPPPQGEANEEEGDAQRLRNEEESGR